MGNLKIKTLLLTILCLVGFTGFGILLYKFHNETLYALIGIIVLIFVRHTYVLIDNLITKE